jgi:DNA segregation ATPase FtsK/SpoIIIE, S-DNA-T family
MSITGLAPLYRGRVLIPVIAEVAAGGPVDRVTVKLVSGHPPADFANRAEGIAHGFGAHLCRVRPIGPEGVDRKARRGTSDARPGP